MAQHVQRFREQETIEIADTLSRTHGVSAAWREECADAVERIIIRARHHDLVVLGLPSRINDLPPDLIERLLVGCGRPVLVAPSHTRQRVTGTVLVFWKEAAVAARAPGAPLPLLLKSKRVVIVSVEEVTGEPLDDIRDLTQQLTLHGISAEFKWMSTEARSAADRLASAADYDANLLVMGGYGHSRMGEAILGGCTQHFLHDSEWAVFFMY